MSTALANDLVTQDFLNFDESGITFEPDYAALSTVSTFYILGALNPSLADVVSDFAANVTDISGTVTIIDGLLESDLTLPDGSALEGEFDIPATLANFAQLAADISGSASLVDGMLTADLTTDEDSLLMVEDLDVATTLSTLLLDTLNAINTVVSFADGAFIFAEETPLGPFGGTIDIAGGDLNLDLDTPFGDVVADVDFGEAAVVPFVVPTPLGDVNGTVDLNAGNVVASLGFFGDIAVPISEIDGQIALADGVATFSSDLPVVGSVDFDFEFGPLASETVATFLQDLTADATITDGTIEARLDSVLGLLETTFDTVAFTNQGADFFSEVDGDLVFENGDLAVNLSTPLGNVDSIFDLETAAGLLDVPLGALI